MNRARRRPTRVHLTGAGVAVLLLGLLVGCGGGGTPDGEATPDAPASSASSSAPAETPGEIPTATPSETPTATPTATPTDSEPAADTVPTSYDVAAALVDAAPGPAQRANRFQTPGGGIFCILDSDFYPTSCELAQGASVPAPDVCGSEGPSDAVGRVELIDGVATPICNSDTIREGRARDLRVGETTSIGDRPVRCLAQTAGIVCVDDDARSGFFVGDGRYEVF